MRIWKGLFDFHIDRFSESPSHDFHLTLALKHILTWCSCFPADHSGFAVHLAIGDVIGSAWRRHQDCPQACPWIDQVRGIWYQLGAIKSHLLEHIVVMSSGPSAY